MKRSFKKKIACSTHLKFVTILLSVLFVMQTNNGITQDSTVWVKTSWIDCENDSIKPVCYSDYALLLEYAELGFDYDSTVASHDREIAAKDSVLLLREVQIEACKEGAGAAVEAIDNLNADLSKANKRIRILKAVGLGSIGLNAVLLLLLLVK